MLVAVAALPSFLGFKDPPVYISPPCCGAVAMLRNPPMDKARKEVEGGWGFSILYPLEGSGCK